MLSNRTNPGSHLPVEETFGLLPWADLTILVLKSGSQCHAPLGLNCYFLFCMWVCVHEHTCIMWAYYWIYMEVKEQLWSHFSPSL